MTGLWNGRTRNCVFIDESGFNVNMRNNYARSPTGSRAVVMIPKTRATSHTVIGAIHPASVICVVLKKPPPKKQTPDQPKKRRKDNKGRKRADPDNNEEEVIKASYEEAPPISKGTTTLHFIKFINELLDIMDLDVNLKGSYLVLDYSTIHKSHPMRRKIESRGYKIMFLPPYSPELNPIEQFWSLVKGKLKRSRFMTEESLSSRIADAQKN